MKNPIIKISVIIFLLFENLCSPYIYMYTCRVLTSTHTHTNLVMFYKVITCLHFGISCIQYGCQVAILPIFLCALYIFIFCVHSIFSNVHIIFHTKILLIHRNTFLDHFKKASVSLLRYSRTLFIRMLWEISEKYVIMRFSDK